MTRHELQIEYDMLIGNVNRMMTSDDEKELYTMYAFAGRRLMHIYTSRYTEIIENHKKEDKNE